MNYLHIVAFDGMGNVVASRTVDPAELNANYPLDTHGERVALVTVVARHILPDGGAQPSPEAIERAGGDDAH